MRSRLAGGLCVEMGALDEPLRIKILEARIAAGADRSLANFEVSPAVLAFVAHTLNSNGRDLDGAVNRLLAHTNADRRDAQRRSGGDRDQRSRCARTSPKG